jgi:ParB-like chromosome segregation protein Spo0J
VAVRTKTREVAAEVGGDARIEEELTKKGVTWAFDANADVEQFDPDESLRNQARFEPVDEKQVESYAEAMRRGDVFPPVIASQNKRGKLVIIDGNHRLQAAIKAKKRIKVYDITGAPANVITLLTFEMNTKHGKPTSEAERIQQALYLMANGATMNAAAAAVNIPLNILKKASQKASTDQRFIDNNIPALTIEKLSESVKWRLAHISTDEGFVAAVDLAVAAKLSVDQVFDLVTRLNSVKSSSKQVEMVGDIRVDYLGQVADTGGGVFGSQKKMMGPRTRVGLALSNVLALPDDLQAVSNLWAAAERDDAAKKMRAAAKRLNELARTLSS